MLNIGSAYLNKYNFALNLKKTVQGKKKFILFYKECML